MLSILQAALLHEALHFAVLHKANSLRVSCLQCTRPTEDARTACKMVTVVRKRTSANLWTVDKETPINAKTRQVRSIAHVPHRTHANAPMAPDTGMQLHALPSLPVPHDRMPCQPAHLLIFITHALTVIFITFFLAAILSPFSASELCSPCNAVLVRLSTVVQLVKRTQIVRVRQPHHPACLVDRLVRGRFIQHAAPVS